MVSYMLSATDEKLTSLYPSPEQIFVRQESICLGTEMDPDSREVDTPLSIECPLRMYCAKIKTTLTNYQARVGFTKLFFNNDNC